MADNVVNNGGVSGTVFGGDTDPSSFKGFDAYVDDFSAKKRLLDARTAGLIDGVSGLSIFKNDDPPNCKKPLFDIERVEYEKSGTRKALERLSDSVKNLANSCAYRSARDAIKGAAMYSRMDAIGEDRWKAALVGLSTALPFQLSKACQNVIDNFAKNVKSRYSGYDRITPGGSKFVESDAVQCAMEAMEMLTGIKGLKGKIQNTLIDIEASAVVIAGMIKTLIDYEMIEDIEAVIGTSPSTRAAKRAIGLSEAAISNSGNLRLINWMLDELGVPETIGYNPDVCTTIVENYRYIEPGDDQYFFTTLSRINPDWDRSGELYYFGVIGHGSPDAINAFNNNDAYRSLSMISDIEFIETKSTVRHPTIGEVTRQTYPLATGPGLVTDMSINDPRYFFV